MIGWFVVGLAILAIGTSGNSREQEKAQVPPGNPRWKVYGYNGWGYAVNSNGELIHRIKSAHYDGPIPTGWVVHHVNGKKQDNDIDNLVQMPKYFHQALHQKHGPYLPYNKSQIIKLVNEMQG